MHRRTPLTLQSSAPARRASPPPTSWAAPAFARPSSSRAHRRRRSRRPPPSTMSICACSRGSAWAPRCGHTRRPRLARVIFRRWVSRSCTSPRSSRGTASAFAAPSHSRSSRSCCCTIWRITDRCRVTSRRRSRGYARRRPGWISRSRSQAASGERCGPATFWRAMGRIASSDGRCRYPLMAGASTNRISCSTWPSSPISRRSRGFFATRSAR